MKSNERSSPFCQPRPVLGGRPAYVAIVDELLRLLDEARADERSDSRQRERRLRQVAEEAATLAGTLLDLAEHGTPVTVRTASGRSHHGSVRLVASDFCVVGEVWVALRAITTVRPDPGQQNEAAAGDRPSLDLLLSEALSRIAPERPRIALVARNGDVVAGELRSVGADVVTLRLDGDQGACYVSTSAIGEVLPG